MPSETKMFASAEDISERTLAAQNKIREGGEGAIRAHFELNKIAAEAENLKEEAEKENGKETGKMKKLIEIDNKNKLQEPLSKDELIFLYENYTPFEGFNGINYDKPLFGIGLLIAEIIASRNTLEDAPTVLGCRSEEIAYNREMIDENTKVYIGPLFPNIFSYNFEHIYTSFPEGRIEKAAMTIGVKTKEEINEDLKKRVESNNKTEKIYIDDHTKSMMNQPEFDIVKKPEKISLIRLKVSDLGFTNNATIDEISKEVEKLGLELCPPEVGPYLRLKYEEVFKREQPKDENLKIGMKPICAGSIDSTPSLFRVCRASGGESSLSACWARPQHRWDPRIEFIFTHKLDI